MANGLLEEIRRIAESSKDIPQEVVNRLMLTALAELVVKVDKQTDIDVQKTTCIDEAIEQLNISSDALSRQMTDLNTKLSALTLEISAIRSNPVISLGNFIKHHPKTAFAISVLVAMSALILLSSRPFLTLVLTLAGVPSGAIEQILLIISS